VAHPGSLVPWFVGVCVCVSRRPALVFVLFLHVLLGRDHFEWYNNRQQWWGSINAPVAPVSVNQLI